MNRVAQASALVAAAVAVFALAGQAAAQECPVLLGCAGMELAQSAAPDDSAPDANSGAPPSDATPDDGSADDNAQAPGDDGAGNDDGANSDQASPPDTAQPPGCIFQDGPLELLV
ncbi:hypothetical protein [Hyphomicrobium sp.]|jgi:hypothetical protein|uniref:hypothetical protein n=1 Tax=Hyphomicrobium sp. TaxID=82 RepID=UPI00356B02DD